MNQFKRITYPVCLTVLLLATGCEEEPRHTSRPKIKTREILGKTTQDIRPAEPELKTAGAEVAPAKVVAKDPITLSGNVYVVAVDRYSMGLVQHALDLYKAEHDQYPKTHKEFMDEVIKPGKPDGVRLPQLPYYQEYGYDESAHKLIILEYQDRKARLKEQQDKELGRK